MAKKYGKTRKSKNKSKSQRGGANGLFTQARSLEDTIAEQIRSLPAYGPERGQASYTLADLVVDIPRQDLRKPVGQTDPRELGRHMRSILSLYNQGPITTSADFASALAKIPVDDTGDYVLLIKTMIVKEELELRERVGVITDEQRAELAKLRDLTLPVTEQKLRDQSYPTSTSFDLTDPKNYPLYVWSLMASVGDTVAQVPILGPPSGQV